jgi:negative regulator of flagellin synthesis FlgM
MNINSNKPAETQGPNRTVQPPQNVQKPETVDAKEKAGPARSASPADRVDISNRSKEISDIMAAAEQLPDVRTDKVQQIKQSIEAGTYTVDPSKIAASILKDI